VNDLNRVQRIGHLGQDPEVKYTATGTARTSLAWSPVRATRLRMSIVARSGDTSEAYFAKPKARSENGQGGVGLADMLHTGTHRARRHPRASIPSTRPAQDPHFGEHVKLYRSTILFTE
jgi:hypothetical protein